ncbi:unnamed protein product [Linum tenue]|uniref:DUF1664 domain-containing protein n=1 Tax=Linum tenue TaxID=586396 RepID=A0AAV0HE94_9ROSI|nr:unnamed protein product [Linum tenue]
MAMQTAAVSSKVLILVGAGAGLTSSIILKNGRLSEVIAQLQELLKGVQDAETSPYRYDTAVLAAQIRQLAQEIKEISMNNPVTIFNGNYESGSLASYVMPAAALGAMGYCYMLWKACFLLPNKKTHSFGPCSSYNYTRKGWSLSDVMFVTKHNMQNAVASVSKQLEHLSESLANTKKHLTKRLENLDWKMDEQMESSNQIASNVGEMNSNLSEIGFNVGTIHQMIAGLDATNSGILYLCQVAQGMKDGFGRKVSKELGAKVANLVLTNGEEISLKGLQFLVEEDSMFRASKPIEKVKTADPDITSLPGEKLTSTRPGFIHRTYPVGLSGFGTGA